MIRQRQASLSACQERRNKPTRNESRRQQVRIRQGHEKYAHRRYGGNFGLRVDE